MIITSTLPTVSKSASGLVYSRRWEAASASLADCWVDEERLYLPLELAYGMPSSRAPRTHHVSAKGTLVSVVGKIGTLSSHRLRMALKVRADSIETGLDLDTLL